MRKFNFTTCFSTKIDEKSKIIFFSKNGPVDPYRKIFLVKDHIPTYMEKLITFRIPPGLIKMYVLAAVVFTYHG